jgi:glycosyltransferase involved in cell wall biosynthesis
MCCSHLLVVPSFHEGFGIAYLEGMGFGLPAIATTRGGAAEIITHGENGFLVPPGDPGGLADILRRVLGDRDLLASLSLAALRRYEQQPTWQETAEQVRDFLLLLVNTNSTDKIRSKA